ncbi:MAG: hypothetical protein JO106_11455 [Mycobacterium sp.]|nr:hypothetical protein [Mycobacterium sp.]
MAGKPPEGADGNSDNDSGFGGKPEDPFGSDDESSPWYLKPWVLAIWGLMVVALIAVIVYGLVELASGGGGTPSRTTTTTTTTSSTTTTTSPTTTTTETTTTMPSTTVTTTTTVEPAPTIAPGGPLPEITPAPTPSHRHHWWGNLPTNRVPGLGP